MPAMDDFADGKIVRETAENWNRIEIKQVQIVRHNLAVAILFQRIAWMLSFFLSLLRVFLSILAKCVLLLL